MINNLKNIRNLCIAFLLIFFWGCEQNTDHNESNNQTEKFTPIKKTDTLRWLGEWLGEAAREKLLFETKRLFEFENQEVFVKLEFPDDEGDPRGKVKNAEEKILQSLKTRNFIWDVIWCDHYTYNLYAQELNNINWGTELLIDFSEFEFFKKYHKSFIYEDEHYRNKSGGILTGPYIDGFAHILWYNSELANEMNLDIKQFDMNIDEFIVVLKKVEDYNKQNNTEYAAFYDHSNGGLTGMLFQNLVISHYGTLDYQDVSSVGKINALNAVIAKFEEMGKYKPLIKNQSEIQWDETKHYPLEKKCLFYISGSWIYNHWERIDKEKLKNMIPAQLPYMKKSNTYLGGYSPAFAVVKNSKGEQAGIQLLKYFSLPETADKWINYTKSPTGLSESINEKNLDYDPLDKFRNTISQKYGSNLNFFYDHEYLNDTDITIKRGAINNTLLDLLKGNITSEDALELIIEQN